MWISSFSILRTALAFQTATGSDETWVHLISSQGCSRTIALSSYRAKLAWRLHFLQIWSSEKTKIVQSQAVYRSMEHTWVSGRLAWHAGETSSRYCPGIPRSQCAPESHLRRHSMAHRRECAAVSLTRAGSTREVTPGEVATDRAHGQAQRFHQWCHPGNHSVHQSYSSHSRASLVDWRWYWAALASALLTEWASRKHSIHKSRIPRGSTNRFW